MSVVPLPELRADVYAVLDEVWLNAVETGGYHGRQLDYLRSHGEGARKRARERVYDWLAEQMWLLPGDCHVRCFTEDQCFEAICLLHGLTYGEVRRWSWRRRQDRAYAERIERRLAA